ncbi:hypothetical protein D3C81_418000 [compost metagenome]
MVEADRADGVEAAQVIFVRHVVAVPGDHVQWRMVELAAPQFTEEFLHQLHRAIDFFVMGHRREEVARVGQAVAADRPQVRDAQRRTVVLGQIAAGLGIEQFDTKLQATGQHGDFQRLDFQHAQFSDDAQATLLGHQQQFAIGVEEHPLHGAIGAIGIDADTRRFFTRRVGRHGHPAVNEVGRFAWDRLWAPAQAIGRHRAQRATGQLALQALEARVQGRRANAVQPGAAQLAAGHGEGGAGKQFGIQAVRGFLRRVLPDRQGARQGFAGEFVTETALVAEDRGVIEVHRASGPSAGRSMAVGCGP